MRKSATSTKRVQPAHTHVKRSIASSASSRRTAKISSPSRVIRKNVQSQKRSMMTASHVVSADAKTLPSGVKSFGVIGSGQMGNGIAIVSSNVAKIPTFVLDVNDASLDKAKVFASSYFDKQVKKGTITRDDADSAFNRITYTKDYSVFMENKTNFIVEAATEDLQLKQRIFETLDKSTIDDAILASNTSSISITKIAASTQRPDKVIGMHFMNPVPVMKLIEIIPGLRTSLDTLTTTLQLSNEMNKITTQSKDSAGFIANRILMPYINEAAYVLHEGIATCEDIDTTMKLGTNVPMGPLTLADFIGLDTCLSIMQTLHAGTGGDSKYRPSPILQQYVDAGYLGKKTGRGFYDYSTPKQ